MKPTRYKDKLLIYWAFVSALLIIAAVVFFTNRADKQYSDNTAWVIHTHQVLTESEHLFSLIKDTQRGQRGYILTQDHEYLMPYMEAKGKVGTSMQTLKRLTTDQSIQQKRLQELQMLIQQALFFWDKAITINDLQGAQAAVALIKEGTGKRVVDTIGRIVKDFKQHERALLSERQQQFEASKQQFRFMKVLGWISSFLLLIGTFVLLLTRLKREEALSHTLDRKVQERTQQLEVSNTELQSSLEEVSATNHQLQQLNNDLDNFVYTASHDLRSPITNLQGLLRVLSKRLAGRITFEEQEILRYMEQSAFRLNRTINDLSEITKMQKEEQVKEYVTFYEVAQEVSEDLMPMIRESGAEIKLDFQVEHVYYAYKHLRSILYNLLSNAIKYRSSDRSLVIKVQSQEEQDFVCLSISDNGLGLGQKELEKIFQMFKRFHTHVEGSGIGLYMIKRMVENNAGRIEVESQKGVGTTFQVYFRKAFVGLQEQRAGNATS